MKYIIIGLIIVLFTLTGYLAGRVSIQKILEANAKDWTCTIDNEPVNGYCISANDWKRLTE